MVNSIASARKISLLPVSLQWDLFSLPPARWRHWCVVHFRFARPYDIVVPLSVCPATLALMLGSGSNASETACSRAGAQHPRICQMVRQSSELPIFPIWGAGNARLFDYWLSRVRNARLLSGYWLSQAEVRNGRLQFSDYWLCGARNARLLRLMVLSWARNGKALSDYWLCGARKSER